MSESGTPAALRCTAPCLPQLTKLREERKSCAKCCAASKNPAIILAKLAVETTDKRARFQTAKTVLSSSPAVPSNLSRRSEASLNEARIQNFPLHNTRDRSSRRPFRQERSYSNCPKTDPVSHWPQPCCSTARPSLPPVLRQICSRLGLKLRGNFLHGGDNDQTSTSSFKSHNL